MHLNKAMTTLVVVLACAYATQARAADMPVTQPYRAVGETTQWLIEGQRYGLMKVRVRINGELVADGLLPNSNFQATYRERPVRTVCTVNARFPRAGEVVCAVYVADELAANLVFQR